MKIGLVRRGYSGSGGAEAFLNRFAAALRAAGHDCVLFADRRWAPWPHGELIPVESAAPAAFAAALERIQPRSHCDFLFSLERVTRCDCYRAGDGVHRAWLERRARFEPAWKTWFRTLQPKHRQILELERRLFRPESTPAIVANSKLVKNEIVSGFDYPPERIHVIYNGLPAAPPFDPDLRTRTRNELGANEEELVILFAGTGWERKGLRFALEGFARAELPRARMLVAGRGNPRPFSHDKRVEFLGPVKDLRPFYAAADLFLLPTLYDPFSNACLEALAAGLPVITTAHNGFSEVLTPGETGEILPEPDDIEGMVHALRRWQDPSKRLGIKDRLRALGTSFSIEANLNSTLKVIL